VILVICDARKTPEDANKAVQWILMKRNEVYCTSPGGMWPR